MLDASLPRYSCTHISILTTSLVQQLNAHSLILFCFKLYSIQGLAPYFEDAPII